MSDDPRQKMKALLQQVSRIVPPLLITSGIALSGLILWYLLYGSCGYVSVKSSIKDMNTILYGWQALRDTTIPEFSKNGAVTYETIAIMEEWRTLAYQLKVPSCLAGARSTLIDAIESDAQTFKLAKDRITIDKKLEYLSSNDALFVRYKEHVDLIESCAPTCNVDTDFHDLPEVLHKIIRGEEWTK
ncbi:MAG: hypothetical protein H7Y59_06635 [Anaerolineales bacterium]|nr:hypothetical protein [Anaerolineales bacterium]